MLSEALETQLADAPLPATMRAAVLQGVGQPIAVLDVPVPQPAPGQVLVRLHAAALNHRDVWIWKGQYAGLKFPLVPGSDGAGVVAAIGSRPPLDAEGQPRFALGQGVVINPSTGFGPDERAHSPAFEVLGLPQNGTLAQYVLVAAEQVFPMPSHLGWGGAAALSLAGHTAYRALFTRGQLQPGERVLIHGIGGGVALIAMQLALAAGATVWATSSSNDKLARARHLGAHGTANYADLDWHKTLLKDTDPFDLVLDGAGGPNFGRLLDICAPGGRVVVYGGTAGPIGPISPQRLFWRHLSILGTTMGSPADFGALLRFVSTHKIEPHIDSTWPLAQAEAAFAHLAKGGQMGKVAIEIN